jgi:hypothetical protein
MLRSRISYLVRPISAMLVMPAAVLLLFVPATDANAFWVSSSGGESVNGAGVSGCMAVNGDSTKAHARVGFFPCDSDPGEQWTYSNSELVGLGGNCLTLNSSYTKVEMDPCTGSPLKQLWVAGSTSSGNNWIQSPDGESYYNCLNTSGKVGNGEQLTVGSCGSSWSFRNAFWITRGGGESVNGAEVTGCMDINYGSIAQHTPVGFYPCTTNANEQWTFANGEIIGLGGNCLTENSSAQVEMDSCVGSLAQTWEIVQPPKYGENGNVIANLSTGYCINAGAHLGLAEQLTVGDCTGQSAWSLVN